MGIFTITLLICRKLKRLSDAESDSRLLIVLLFCIFTRKMGENKGNYKYSES